MSFSSITRLYSGIVLDQSATTAGSIDLRANPTFAGKALYQTFNLPDDYIMGSSPDEQRVPNLSGLQVMVSVDPGYAATATLDYTLEYYADSGWTTLISGQQIGSQSDGECWMNLIFPDPVEMNSEISGSLLRIGLTAPTVINDVIYEPVQKITTDTYLVEGQTIYIHLVSEHPYPVNVNGRDGFLLNDQGTVTFSAQQGVGKVYYSENSLLTPAGNLYQSDGLTPAIDATANLNFRVLALTADSGTSFLGNEYRSCVIQQDGHGTDTGSDYWLSRPQPSPFAIVSRYWDMRPSNTSASYDNLNLIPNPSFEYDFVTSTSPYGWLAYDNLTTRSNFSVINTWATSGSQALRSTTIFPGNVGAASGIVLAKAQSLSVTSNSLGPYSAGAKVNVLSVPQNSTGVQIIIDWYNQNNQIVTSSIGSVSSEVGQMELKIENLTAPPTTTYGLLRVSCGCDTSGVLDFEIDAIQFVKASVLPVYNDGDSPGWRWLGQRGRSVSGPFADTVIDLPVVIDGVLVDPSTPNMAFNVYYSNDETNDSDHMTEADWENKLWSRVPKVFTCTQRQQYFFPEPIFAKYMKLEFCNLHPQSYFPGSFPQAVTYKKMPTWVADFFITQLSLPTFTSSSISVQNDALTLAYDYYLDDLNQSPSDPSLNPPTKAQLTSYFQKSDAADYVDAGTLAKINLIMDSYQLPTGSIINPNTLLGSAAQSLLTSGINESSLTAEVPPLVTNSVSIVSSLNREPVVFEQTLPVLFFFLTCRHGYKEVASDFESNLAYFAGTNSIEFLRLNFDIESDQELYVESGGDSLNTFRNDFIVNDSGYWYVD